LPSKLPPGRHNLTREQVVADQRGRMIVALGQAMTEKGFAGTTVADIIERAKVSKQTFYQQYDSKQACFMDAFARIHQKLSASSAAVQPRSAPIEAFDVLLGKYLETMARNADLARVYLIEVYAAGPDALRLRRELQQNTVDGLAALVGADTAEGRFACRALIAAIGALVTHELITTGPDGVRALHADLMPLAKRLLEPQH
jgi:AcrR family transcriptional regulator